MRKLMLIVIVFAAVIAAPIQADFIQCVALVFCQGSPNSDVINGTPSNDDIEASDGDDILFGGDGPDAALSGQQGNDLIFGGNHSDYIIGDAGNDIILAGPDDNVDDQNSLGGFGNDTIHILVGETTNCYFIDTGGDFDVVNLIGFGPHSATLPFGQEGIPALSQIIIEDPVAGGLIFIRVETGGTNSVEQINGLMNPTVTIVENAALPQILADRCNLLT
jgi:Ca2+-binding RTX toxin-like protein